MSSFRATFQAIGHVFGDRRLDREGLPLSGSHWGELGRVVRFTNPGLDEEIVVPNSHPLGRSPKRVIEGIRGQAELISSDMSELRLKSKSAHHEIIVIMEY
jgi:hypothetical protein